MFLPMTPMQPIMAEYSNRSFLFCTQFFPGESARNRTGGIISNLNLLRSLASMADVRVLSFDATAAAADFDSEPFSVISRPGPGWGAAEIFRYWLPFVRAQVEDVLRQISVPDAVVATTSSLAAFDVVPAGVKRIAIIQAFENFGFNCPWVPWRSRISLAKGAILRRLQDRRLLRSADAIFTNSKFMRDAISRRFEIDPSRIYILPQQVDVTPSTIGAPPRTIGFVHRGADKNIALIDDIARLAPDLKFFVYGHNSGFPKNLPGNVELKGWSVDRSAMFGSAALWLVPSLWAEPFGRVSIEAQAAERPVLVADCGGLPETVSDIRYRIGGYDPADWLDRIRLLLTLPRKELAVNGAQVRTKFSQEAHDVSIAKTLATIFNS